LLASFCLAAGLFLGRSLPASPVEHDPGALPPWRVPDVATLPDDDAGRVVRYGRDLLQHTSALIGPDAKDPPLRYAIAGLECSNCHLDAGTQRYSLPLVGIAGLYPSFSARLGRVESLAERINDCMQRSMNGRPLPEGGREMSALLAYIRFLGSDQPAGTVPVGRGALPLPLPARAADPARGRRVYSSNCSGCHGPSGQGVRYAPQEARDLRRRYLFPPLWGAESYNDGAGMARNIVPAWFVHANMPRGVTFGHPVLLPEQAYDVAAFMNAQTRPAMPGLTQDYPDPWLKPADAAFAPLTGPFSSRQHAFGPWPPINAWMRANRPPMAVGQRGAGEVEAISTAPWPSR